MTDPLTDARLAELDRLLAAATPGPWESYGDNLCALKPFLEFGAIHEVPDCNTQSANGRLIVAAVNTLPALLAEVRRLREEVERLTRERDDRATACRVHENTERLLLARAESAERAVSVRLVAHAMCLRNLLAPTFSADTAARGETGVTPSFGHCAAVALVVQESMGGQLVSASVNGVSHWFNRICGYDVDLTADQFGGPIVLVAPEGTAYGEARVRDQRDVRAETHARAEILARKAGLFVGEA